MSANYCEIVSLIGHQALVQGGLRKPPPGFEYEGSDDRGLPIWLVSEQSRKYRLLEGVGLWGMPMLN